MRRLALLASGQRGPLRPLDHNGLSDEKNNDFFSRDLHNQQFNNSLYGFLKTQKGVCVVYPHGFLEGVQPAYGTHPGNTQPCDRGL